MQQGYIRLYRCILDKGWHNKPDYVAVWVYVLMRGNYKETEVMVDGKIMTLQPGQFLTSRKQVSIMTGVSESKIQRILSLFENEHQIEQQTFSKNRVITIVNWAKYQAREHHNEHQMNGKRTADEQQVNTDKEGKKERSKEEEPKNLLGGGVVKEIDRLKKLHLSTCGLSSLPPLKIIEEILASGKDVSLIDDVYQMHGGDIPKYRQRNIVEKLTAIRDGEDQESKIKEWLAS